MASISPRGCYEAFAGADALEQASRGTGDDKNEGQGRPETRQTASESSPTADKSRSKPQGDQAAVTPRGRKSGGDGEGGKHEGKHPTPKRARVEPASKQLDWGALAKQGSVGNQLVFDLRAYCKEHHLSTAGNKAALVERVLEHIKSGDEKATDSGSDAAAASTKVSAKTSSGETSSTEQPSAEESKAETETPQQRPAERL